jgi:hypothetical protein
MPPLPLLPLAAALPATALKPSLKEKHPPLNKTLPRKRRIRSLPSPENPARK